ncbi:neurotrophin receptor-interacting factor homolog [Centropristis striata]|uniref:neurotrophin receptor-interacting factor homolog n=1 Tax=Centropristis striata TaxID=184440 RepID=UPI0027E0BEA7|nr:neurotrophin receptor-interacting factor homolog [Centropristis striata]
MSEPQQPVTTLAQMLAEVAAMSRDQAALNRQQLTTLQFQAERQVELLEVMVRRAGTASSAPSLAGITLHKMAAHDDPQTFLEMFEATATVCNWPEEEWAVQLLPLLSGDAQTAALGLPGPSRGQYGGIKRAILDRLGFSAEDRRRKFRAAKLGPADRPFVIAQQLKDAATRWLQPGDSAGEERLLEKVVLEQFMEGLPAATSDWVCCHHPADLAAAITLAEDHLAVLSWGRAHEGRPASPVGPIPAPRRRPGRAPSPPHQLDPLLALALIPPLFSVLPRLQPLRALLSTHRGFLRRQGRSAGGVDNPDTSVESVHSWRSVKWSGLSALQHPPPVQEGRTAFRLMRQAEGWGPFCLSRCRASTARCSTSAGSCPKGRPGTARWRGSAWPSGGRSMLCGTTCWDAHSPSARTMLPSSGSTA